MQLSGAIAGRLFALSLALCMGTAIRSASIVNYCAYLQVRHRIRWALVQGAAGAEGRERPFISTSYVALYQVLDHTQDGHVKTATRGPGNAKLLANTSLPDRPGPS